MPKASAVAAELRKLADSLDKYPDLEIDKPYLSFFYWREEHKQKFLNTVRCLPRPVVKEWPKTDDGAIVVIHENDAIRIKTELPKSLTCELVEPAKPAVYRCNPLLSNEEEESLGLSIQGGAE